MPPVEFEPTISASERPQTYALDRAATGIGGLVYDTVTKFGETAAYVFGIKAFSCFQYPQMCMISLNKGIYRLRTLALGTLQRAETSSKTLLSHVAFHNINMSHSKNDFFQSVKNTPLNECISMVS